MPLHDILPPIQLENYTFFYLGGLLLVCLFMFLFKYLYKREKKDAKYYLHILEQCDFQDAKKTALQFSYYGKYIFTDEVIKADFIELQPTLKKYKYLQDLTPIPPHLEKSIKELLAQARQYV